MMPTLKIDRHHCINLTVNGVQRRFLIDTGANHTVVDIKWAKRRDKHIHCEGIGGKVEAFAAFAEFRLFGKSLERYVVTDIEFKDSPTGLIDGIIGRDFLLKFRSVEFNYAEGVVRFKP